MMTEARVRRSRTARALKLSPLLLALPLLGCGAEALAFEPAGASSSVGALYAGTTYDMNIGSATLGDATVWSEGATGGPSQNVDVIDVEVALRNKTNTPIRLGVEKSTMSVITRAGQRAPLRPPIQVAGSQTAAPESTARVGLHYALPNGIVASEVAQFDFDWHVESPAGDYAQSTRFVPTPAPTADSLPGRTYSCDGQYRITNVGECVNPAPLLSMPIR